jgi:antitoxin PrlF
LSTSSVTVKGQVTIPSAIRRQLKIKPGDRVRFVELDGRVFIARQDQKVASAFGLLKARRKVSQADMDRAVLNGWLRRARR